MGSYSYLADFRYIFLFHISISRTLAIIPQEIPYLMPSVFFWSNQLAELETSVGEKTILSLKLSYYESC